MKTPLRLFVATFALAAFNLSAATLYVSLASPNPSPPYTNWATAAHVIQDAVDAAKAGDTVLVTNGVYAVGKRTNRMWGQVEYNRVAITNAIRIESVNGPSVTTIEGGAGLRCVDLRGGALMSGFTIINGSHANGCGDVVGGGGVQSDFASVVTNCIFQNNRVSGGVGGGAHGGSYYNCTFVGNLATDFWSLCAESYKGGGAVANAYLHSCTLADNHAGSGGGAYNCTLYNCTLTGNSAERGGGAFGGTLYNCTVTGNNGQGIFGAIVFNSIVYYNSGGNYDTNTSLNYCCTTPLPPKGIGNIAGAPLFVDMAAGNFRLSEVSPCIDAGTNVTGCPVMGYDSEWNWAAIAYITDPTDILGNTRFVDGNGDDVVAWDIGASEFKSFKPPRFSAPPKLTAEGWKFSIVGPTNKWIGLQRSSDFTGWWNLQPPSLTDENGVCHIIDADTGPKLMFYRAVVP